MYSMYSLISGYDPKSPGGYHDIPQTPNKLNRKEGQARKLESHSEGEEKSHGRQREGGDWVEEGMSGSGSCVKGDVCIHSSE